ncbi:MAG: hypothetical protein FWE08_01065 [Oscillospiraceae bacterium]|nr:hypothetical protein [Oscillospiraceae bacterium]
MSSIYPKRAVRSVLAILSVFICLISSLSIPAAYAATAGQVTLTIQQSFVSDGTSAPPSGIFTYRLTPRTPAAPMPGGSTSEGYTFTVTGTDTVQIGPIRFTETGVYVYELRSITEDRPGHIIDRQVYTITVHVTEDLTAIVIISVEDDSKISEMAFDHSYTPQNTPDPTPPQPPPPPPPPSAPDTPTPAPPPGTPGKPDIPDSPKTGDDSNPAFWIALITGSSTLILLILWLGWKSGKQRRRGKQ